MVERERWILYVVSRQADGTVILDGGLNTHLRGPADVVQEVNDVLYHVYLRGFSNSTLRDDVREQAVALVPEMLENEIDIDPI